MAQRHEWRRTPRTAKATATPRAAHANPLQARTPIDRNGCCAAGRTQLGFDSLAAAVKASRRLHGPDIAGVRAATCFDHSTCDAVRPSACRAREVREACLVPPSVWGGILPIGRCSCPGFSKDFCLVDVAASIREDCIQLEGGAHLGSTPRATRTMCTLVNARKPALVARVIANWGRLARIWRNIGSFVPPHLDELRYATLGPHRTRKSDITGQPKAKDTGFGLVRRSRVGIVNVLGVSDLGLCSTPGIGR